ncbi:MAG: hypothetical protein V3S82_10435 [Dehalococcoidia bacterium]
MKHQKTVLAVLVALCGCGILTEAPEAAGGEVIAGRVPVGRAAKILEVLQDTQDHGLTQENVSPALRGHIRDALLWAPALTFVNPVQDPPDQALRATMQNLGAPAICSGKSPPEVTSCFMRWKDSEIGPNACQDPIEDGCGQIAGDLCRTFGQNGHLMFLKGSKSGNSCTAVCYAPRVHLRIKCQ